MSAEQNVITTEQMKQVREKDFVRRFTHDGLNKLLEVLNVTRKIPMEEGTTMYYYAVEGELEDGNVGEGEIIPLSQMEVKKYPIGEITLKKWRKAVTAEAIKKSGYANAVTQTDQKVLKLAQNEIRTDFFGFLNGTIIGATTVVGATLQSAFAKAWGQLKVLFEDDDCEPVYFVNPLDVAKYLETAQITVQTAFGLSYVENFLGLGTVILSARITQGTFEATAKENLILYYLTMNGDIAQAFKLTADELGLIGINSGFVNTERAQIESLAMSGIQLFVEYGAGVVKGTIDDSF